MVFSDEYNLSTLYSPVEILTVQKATATRSNPDCHFTSRLALPLMESNWLSPAVRDRHRRPVIIACAVHPLHCLHFLPCLHCTIADCICFGSLGQTRQNDKRIHHHHVGMFRAHAAVARKWFLSKLFSASLCSEVSFALCNFSGSNRQSTSKKNQGRAQNINTH